MIKHRLLIAAVVLMGALLPSAASAGRISIEVGDRPFYRGATYWDNDWEMIWVPGHWSPHHREWIHGHYMRGKNHRRHDNWYENRDRPRYDRQDDRRYNEDRH
jgi:hypothetical protein